jgi:hypothetical protein
VNLVPDGGKTQLPVRMGHAAKNAEQKGVVAKSERYY